jgi:hypothetical protein
MLNLITKKIKLFFFVIFGLIRLIDSNSLYSQITGDPNKGFSPDSVIVFEPSKPLLTYQEQTENLNNAYGLQFAFSENGFGFGAFWQQKISSKLDLDLNFLMNGAKNTDEMDQINYATYTYTTPFKKNRLFNIPLSIGLNYYFIDQKIFDSFKPFLSAGAGFGIIIEAPYNKSAIDTFKIVQDNEGNQYYNPMFGQATEYYIFFESVFSKSTIHGRLNTYIGLGAEFGSNAKTLSKISFRYYYIPFGGDGLESLSKEATKSSFGTATPAIENFGGFSIILNMGIKY